MWKKAVRCETRAAWAMEWVTMMMQYWARSSSISSSIRAVAMGSRAEQGSSIRITSGLMAMARAITRRCCWPPDRPVPGWSSRSETSFQRPARFRACSTTPSSSDREVARPWILGP